MLFRIALHNKVRGMREVSGVLAKDSKGKARTFSIPDGPKAIEINLSDTEYNALISKFGSNYPISITTA